MDADAQFPTDEELGIGEPVQATEADWLEMLAANKDIKHLIDAAVNQRLAQMGMAAGMGAAVGAAPASNQAFEAFTATVRHLIDSQAMQQPGYIKPLPAHELDHRLGGKIEMEALLLKYEAAGTAPLWTVGENGFFECTNALEFAEGDKIRTFLPPAEDFIPENEQARKVHAAMMTWLGGRTPGIGEQVEAAMIAAKQPPLISSVMQAPRQTGPVELVERPSVVEPNIASRKRRSMGTVVPERREVSMAERMSGPSGPVFGGAEA